MGSEIIVAPYTSEELPPYTEEDVFQDAHEELPRSLSQEEKVYSAFFLISFFRIRNQKHETILIAKTISCS